MVRAANAARTMMIADASRTGVSGARAVAAKTRRYAASVACRPRARSGAAAAALAAGDAPGDGDGVAGFGSGAPDCVKTIDVTVRSGDAFSAPRSARSGESRSCAFRPARTAAPDARSW